MSDPSLPERFSIRERVGRGAMGLVLRCHDRELTLDVAVKVLHSGLAGDPKAANRIRREARAAARVRDGPGILPLHSFERFGETAFLVMAYAPGGSLADRLRRDGPRPEEECRSLGAEIADALAFAHSRGVLHRDVKPSNILFAEDGHALVADFGLGKILSEEASRHASASIVGTPVYMAPEVMWGTGGDARSDLYSLGCLLHEISTGEPPFEGSFPEIAGAKSPKGPLPDPRRHRPELSEEFARIVRRLLALDPRKRVQSAAECAALLRSRSHGEESRPMAVPAFKSSRSGRWPVIAFAGLLLAGLLVAAGSGILERPPGTSPEAALPARTTAVEPALPELPPPAAGAPEDLALPPGLERQDGRLYSTVDGAELVLLAGGDFTMGRDDGPPESRPAHRVTLSAFLLDRHEVTVGQFRRFVAATGHRTDAEKAGWANSRNRRGWGEIPGACWRLPSGPRFSDPLRDEDPVTCVSWNDASAYAAWAVRRLPTEAEFEYVLRDGREGAEYPWGDAEVPPPGYGNYRDASFEEVFRGRQALPDYRDGLASHSCAGATRPNSYGLFDVSGNLLEWCADRWGRDAYPSSPVLDPRGPSSGPLRCVRGGAWTASLVRLAAHFRVAYEPTKASLVVGFRCAMDLPR